MNGALIPQLLEFQLIARFRPAGLDCPYRQLQHRMRGQARRHPPGNHLLPSLAHLLFPVQVHDIDGKLHPEAVDGLARGDPQARSRIELAMFQQTRPPLRAGIGHLGRLRQYGSAVAIPHLDLQDDLGYNTVRPPVLRKWRLFGQRRVIRGNIEYCRVPSGVRSIGT